MLEKIARRMLNALRDRQSLEAAMPTVRIVIYILGAIAMGFILALPHHG